MSLSLDHRMNLRLDQALGCRGTVGHIQMGAARTDADTLESGDVRCDSIVVFWG